MKIVFAVTNKQIRTSRVVDKWKLNEEQLQKLLLVQRVVIAPRIGENLEVDNEASEGIESRRDKEVAQDCEGNETR